MENRIYIDGKLVNVCYNQYVLMCNVAQLREKYGDRVTVKKVKPVRDKEYTDWLESF